jgi:hypothetical protein
MREPREPSRRWAVAYQTVVLGISAAVIVVASLIGVRAFQSFVAQPGSVSLGLTAAGQVIGGAAAHGPAADTLPGLAGTATPTETTTPTETRVPTATITVTATPSPTLTPDIRTYDPNRAKTLLAQAQTSWGSTGPEFLSNVTLAAERLNGQQVAPGATLSFNSIVGPFDENNGYRYVVPGSQGVVTTTVSTVDGGITQVSSTFFQAAFWSGLSIVERQAHQTWLDRFAAGSTGQRGLDAYVAPNGPDLKIQNTTSDWVRIDATVQTDTLTVSIYGADPGWSVNPNVAPPSHVVQPNPTPRAVIDPQLPSGQQFTVSPGLPGFDVAVQRTVTRAGQVVDRYGVAEHYVPQPALIAVGKPADTPTPTPTPEAKPQPEPVGGGGSPSGAGPTHLAGLNPSNFVLPDGRIKVPVLVGLSELEAQQVIVALGLTTTYSNYQGPGDVPASILNSVDVGEVLSTTPSAGTAVPRGTTIYIAVRKA